MRRKSPGIHLVNMVGGASITKYYLCSSFRFFVILEAKGGIRMLYHVIHMRTFEVKAMNPSDILDMEYDDEDRVIITGRDQQKYYLLASKDLVTEP